MIIMIDIIRIINVLCSVLPKSKHMADEDEIKVVSHIYNNLFFFRY